MATEGAFADRLVELRRDLHRRPEPAWCEFYTTSRIVEAVERVGAEAFVGPDAMDPAERMGVPGDDEIERWRERAIEAGAREDVMAKTEGGVTGLVARIEMGDGPTVALRVDIDGLVRDESADDGHRPAAEGFRSEHEGMMHACAHDANTAIGVGALEAVAGSDFDGTFVVFFQPASENESGGKPMAAGPHAGDLDYLFVVNVGMDHPTGEVVAGVDRMFAIHRFAAEFEGEPAHAGIVPNEGHNAVQAAMAAGSNLYAIPRHADGETRVNVGVIEGGTATNLIAESAHIKGEVRGVTTELMDYMWERAERTLRGGAAMHGCTVETEAIGGAPSADSDAELADLLYGVAEGVDGIASRVRREPFGTGEDAAHLMHAARENGGYATHAIVGTDHPSGHHTATFDVDEASLRIGAELVAAAVREVGRRHPL